MGIWEKNLIVMIVRYLIRWFMSNEKNTKNSTLTREKNKPVKEKKDEN